MESNRKRRGFIKGKLEAPFYKTSKSVSTYQYLTKATSTVYQDHLDPHQQKHKLFFIIPDKGVESLVHYDKLFGTAGDEAVDMKATKYISTVRERFKLGENELGEDRVQGRRLEEVGDCLFVPLLD